MRTAVREFGQTIVMVTHDPVAASYADRAVFLADGRIVDDLDDPTADSVLDRIRTSEADRHVHAHHQGTRRTQAAAAHHRLRGASRCRLHGRHHGLHRHDRCHVRLRAGRRRPGRRRLRPSAIRDRSRLRRARPAARRFARRSPSPRSTVSTRWRCASTATPSWSAPTATPSAISPSNPAFGTNWVTVDDLNPYELVERSGARHADDEIVIDKASADKAGYRARRRRHGAHQAASRGQFTIVGHRHLRFRRLPCRGHRGAVHRRCCGRAAGSTRRGRRDRRHRRTRTQSRPISQRRSRPRSAARSRSSPERRSSTRTRRRSPPTSPPSTRS